MVVNFCLDSESFVNNGETLSDINFRVNDLIALEDELKEINERKESLGLEKDKIYCFNDIYERKILNGKPLYEFICDRNVDNDLKKKLIGFIERTKKTNVDINSEALIYFFKRSNNLIYNKVDLDEFYKIRFKKISSSEVFYNRSIIHFPKLVFSDHVKDSLSQIEGDLENFADKIIKTLTYLNNEIKNRFEEIKDLRRTLDRLTEDISLHASVQGKNKTNLNFEFKIDEKNKKIICCDPHVKYNRGDVATVQKEAYRLYFHMGDADIENEKVLIGHIGIHL